MVPAENLSALCDILLKKIFSYALTTCFLSVYQQAKQRGLTLRVSVSNRHQTPHASQAEIREATKNMLVQYRCKLSLPPPLPPTERMDSSHSIVQTATYRTVPFLFGLISFTVKIFPPASILHLTASIWRSVHIIRPRPRQCLTDCTG